jgi:hypothetical protein
LTCAFAERIAHDKPAATSHELDNKAFKCPWSIIPRSLLPSTTMRCLLVKDLSGNKQSNVVLGFPTVNAVLGFPTVLVLHGTISFEPHACRDFAAAS